MSGLEGEEKKASSRANQIAELAPWFHNLHLPDGTQTFPDHFLGDFPSYKWREIADAIPADLTGWSVLDIGCNAGFYSFELARRGAHVTGIDADEHYLRQARWGAEQFSLQDRVRFLHMQVYDLARLAETFDLVLFLGVLYHLRYPLLALDIVAQKVRRLLLAQTLMTPDHEIYPFTEDGWINEREALIAPGWPRLAFIEHRFAGDPTNWWVPNHACMTAMLRSAGFRVLETPADEFYLCEPNDDEPSCSTTWNAGELLSATGCSSLRIAPSARGE